MFDTCSFKPTNDGFPPSSGGGGGAVTSVFGRTGVVIAVAGDYTSSEITNSSSVTGTYVTDALNTLDTGKLSTTLTNGNIIVGNGSNVATAVAMSGDATIINTGALTISNQAVTFAKMQHISSQHLVGRHAAGSGDIQQISLGTGLSFSGANLQVTGFVPTTLTSANIIVGNNLGVATAVAMSGDTTISNTGAVTISNDAVTTAKILNSNVTYAKIQNVAATRLLGNSTGSPAAAEEITLGTNLSFTGTTLNAAGGGGYTYLAITLSANTSYDKAALGGANYLFISTNNATTRTITIDSTGFVANDFLVLSFSQDSLGLITLVIGTVPRTITNNRGQTIFALFNGTNWILQSFANAYITSNTNNNAFTLGFGSRNEVQTSSFKNNFAIGIGALTSSDGSMAIGNQAQATNGSALAIGINTISNAGSGIAIGHSINGTGADSITIGIFSSGTGANCVRIGNSINTGGTNTGVVAIGQGITTTNTDAVVIGRAASAGGAANVTIGASATGTGANCVRIGNGVTTNNANLSVAIGRNITIPTGGSACVVIGDGIALNTSATNNVISIGASTQGANNTVVIGNSADTNSANATSSVIIGVSARADDIYSNIIGINGRTTKARQFAKGQFSYVRHYGAESRRIDIQLDATDVTNPSRHAENTSWNAQTADATPTIMTLYGVANERLTLQDNEALHFDVYITAKQNGSTNTLIRRIAGGAVRGAGVGSTSIVGQTQLYTHGTALTTTLTADTTNGAVQLQVTGNASTWQWTAYVEYQRTRTA